MDRDNALLRAAGTALTAALMAGCAALLIVRALGFSVPWAICYLAAGAGAALVQLGRKSAVWALAAALAGLAALGALLAAFAPELAAAVRDVGELSAEELAPAHARAGVGAAAIFSLILGALTSGLLCAPSSAPFALVVMITATLCSMAIDEALPLYLALPGLAAGVAAFALPSPSRRGGVRALLLLPGALLALLALALTPAARTTWEPLSALAERIRSVVEDYVHFTEERVAFSINEKGYDRAGMVGDTVVAMLGGPANPSEDEVMRVQTQVNLLLRGTIRRSYTGYSWVDDQLKARYLYYDFTHRGVRNAVFDADTTEDSAGFEMHSASVEMLENGTSTLFVPAQLADFDMGLADAVYYNSAGEIFLTRDVAPGDSYAFSARLPRSEDELIAAAAQAMNRPDERLQDAREDYMQLPSGIEDGVYALAVELTQGSANPAEKAYAIQNYLAQNCHYTLDGGYPEAGRDFVSWFLLEEGEGYCSYFASAMAVMCRIAGLPARYVEGYFVRAQDGGETIVTGRNAHAWVEVYLNGLGWVAFDPTARSIEAHGDAQLGALQQGAQLEDGTGEAGAQGAQLEGADGSDGGADGGADSTGGAEDGTSDGFDGADGAEGGAGDGSDGGADADDSDGGADAETPDGDEATPEPSSSPTPDPAALPDEQEPPQDEPPQDEQSPEGESEDESSRAWLYLLLGALLLAALVLLALHIARRRLAATDPVKLAAGADAEEAALILYRGMLTLLLALGLAPASGETPEAFAERVSAATDNPDYLSFVADVARSRYSGRELPPQALRTGARAYQRFLSGMRRSERLRFHLRRALRGLGSIEQIP